MYFSLYFLERGFSAHYSAKTESVDRCNIDTNISFVSKKMIFLPIFDSFLQNIVTFYIQNNYILCFCESPQFAFIGCIS